MLLSLLEGPPFTAITADKTSTTNISMLQDARGVYFVNVRTILLCSHTLRRFALKQTGQIGSSLQLTNLRKNILISL